MTVDIAVSQERRGEEQEAKVEKKKKTLLKKLYSAEKYHKYV